jgi:signal transduction histidine kinase
MRSALQAKEWDVVLADYSLPHFTALDSLQVLKQCGLDVAFIVVSGSVGERAAVEVMRAGAHDFFLKDNLMRLPAAVERERSEARVRLERKRAMQDLQESQERLRQAVNARDEFLAIASHELKTPLTSLTLNVQSARVLLAKADETSEPLDKLRTRLESAERQTARLTALLNKLLEVTRITSGKLVPAREKLDMRESLQSVLSGLQELARASGSLFRVSAATPVVGRWDRLGIDSVIFNLISNAIKFGERKPIDVELDVQDELARLIVTDHGIGIPPSEQERIFYRFERAVPQKHFGGFGLGLWIVRQIIEAHGGTIAVASKPNCGSIFTVQLPLGNLPAQDE